MAEFKRKTKIVIAESSLLKRKLLQDILHNSVEFSDVIIYFASTGNEARNLFESEHPDIFLMSSDLNGLSAKNSCRWIRANETTRRTGIIFLAHDDKDNDTLSAESLAIGADDFIRDGCSDTELLARVQSVLSFKLMTDDLRRANYQLKEMTLTDDLTGMANMRKFKQSYEQSIKKCRYGMTGLSVIMIDLDDFKKVNDLNDHLVGSTVLGKVGRIINDECSKHKGVLAARYGGDEFIITVESKAREEGDLLAAKIHDLISSHVYIAENVKLQLTSTIGVGWVGSGFDGPETDLIKLADALLYQGKNNGRNIVVIDELRYPIDFDHISRRRCAERNTGGDDDGFPRVDDADSF